MSKMMTVLAVQWVWTDGPHQGAKFWGCHSVEQDGRIRDWPKLGLAPIAASVVDVREGEGLDLLTALGLTDSEGKPI